MGAILAAFSARGPLDAPRLQAGLDAMAHRGPAGASLWLADDRRAALGHRRLSVSEREGRTKPGPGADVVAVVNGAFHGPSPLRRTLETGSPAALLVHLYEARGIECLEALRGEFSFVLWDARKRRLFAARDRFGVKPLYWARRCGSHAGATLRNDTLLVASEAKALFAAGVRAAWDVDAFLHAAHHQYLPPGRSLFDGVHQLRPGTFLLASEAAGGLEIQTKTWWDIDFPRLDRTDNVAALDDMGSLDDVAADRTARALREHLEEAVRVRLPADAPVACALSGGLDSSAIAAIAARHRPEALPVFGVSFGDRVGAYDERPHAEAVAAHIGADYHPVVVRQRDLVEHLPDAVHLAEGLAINGHLTAKYLLGRAIADAGYPVVLTGEGADEALAGYGHLVADAHAADHLAPPPLSEREAGVMLPAGAGLSTEAVHRRLGFVPTFLAAKAELGRRIVEVLAPPLRARTAATDRFERLLASFDIDARLAGRHRADQAAYLWSRLALANYILRTLGDGTEMAHGVAGRVPFLDHRVFELCQRIPLALKIRAGHDGLPVEKWILRRAVADLLPAPALARRKQPFLAPPLCVFSDSASDALVQDVLRSEAARTLPFFEHAKLVAMLDGLATRSARERQATEPVLVTALTACLLHTSLNLEVDL